MLIHTRVAFFFKKNFWLLICASQAQATRRIKEISKQFLFFLALRFFCFELFDVVLCVAGAGDATH